MSSSALVAPRPPSKHPQPWYRQRWPWLLMMGPATVIVAGAVTVWLAIASDDGLVGDDHYRRGLEINRTIERAERAQALGLGAIVDVMPGGVAEVRLTSTVASSDARPAAVMLLLAHPTRAIGDVQATLALAADGRYRGRIESPPAGRWRVSIETRAWRLGAVDVEGPIAGIALGQARR